MTATIKGNKPRIKRDSIKNPMISLSEHEEKPD